MEIEEEVNVCDILDEVCQCTQCFPLLVFEVEPRIVKPIDKSTLIQYLPNALAVGVVPC
jgi:hypothetical protein